MKSKSQNERKLERLARNVDAQNRQQLERLMNRIKSWYRSRQAYTNADGETMLGVLLDDQDCETLAQWWKEFPVTRAKGRPPREPSLFGNPFRQEFEEERQKIISAGGKTRGATKKATAALALKYSIEFETMRKRIKGNKTQRFVFPEK